MIILNKWKRNVFPAIDRHGFRGVPLGDLHLQISRHRTRTGPQAFRGARLLASATMQLMADVSLGKGHLEVSDVSDPVGGFNPFETHQSIGMIVLYLREN